jgi:hypothetical protein
LIELGSFFGVDFESEYFGDVLLLEGRGLDVLKGLKYKLYE